MANEEEYSAPRNLKRKSADESEVSVPPFPLDDFNVDVLERILSWLPTSTFLRFGSVCKRWKSVANSATFMLACSQIPSRDPWFFMVESDLMQNQQPIILDSSDKSWKKLNPPPFLCRQQDQSSWSSFIPVAASAGLICFYSCPDLFIAYNPVTGIFRELPRVEFESHQSPEDPLCAISMSSSFTEFNSYKLVLISGDYLSQQLYCKVYESRADEWGKDVILRRKNDNPFDLDHAFDQPVTTDEDQNVYFLGKGGNVVLANMQRSPSKQYSAVMTVNNGEEKIFFLSPSGTIVVCNLTKNSFSEYPRLLPMYHEYSIDVVECCGEMFVVVLSEILETASLRIWKFDEKMRCWNQVAAMPPAISHEFYGKKMDINCSGAGDKMLICANSAEISRCFWFDLKGKEWGELSSCYVNGEVKDFVCSLSFEPRIEVSA